MRGPAGGANAVGAVDGLEADHLLNVAQFALARRTCSPSPLPAGRRSTGTRREFSRTRIRLLYR
jgi:hypothetical protein